MEQNALFLGKRLRSCYVEKFTKARGNFIHTDWHFGVSLGFGQIHPPLGPSLAKHQKCLVTSEENVNRSRLDALAVMESQLELLLRREVYIINH